MKRLIKFRGKTADGKIIYGDLNHLELRSYSGMLNLPSSVQSFIAINGEAVEDYAQFVGYDKNGKEVYEGDILLDEHNNEHIAEIYDRPNFITKLTLKEQPS